MAEDDGYERLLIDEELRLLNLPEKVSQKWGEMKAAPSIWNEGPSSSPAHAFADPNRHRFNHYADKQLFHLVITEEFDFGKIAAMLNYIFRDERAKFTEMACRERWEELHVLRENAEAVRVKRMEDKRASSVSVFTDPFSLYNLQEMLDRLQKTERQHPAEGSSDGAGRPEAEASGTGRPGAEASGAGRPEASGYNIFKNSIRQIDDIEGYKKREREMQHALNLAQDPTHTIRDKLMHFSPYYERLNEFEVREEELTEEKMREIMSVPFEIESLEMELRVKDMNETAENWKQKRSRREEQKMSKEEHRYEIEEDWDEYESD